MRCTEVRSFILMCRCYFSFRYCFYLSHFVSFAAEPTRAVFSHSPQPHSLLPIPYCYQPTCCHRSVAPFLRVGAARRAYSISSLTGLTNPWQKSNRMRVIESASDIFLSAAADIQLRLPIRSGRNELNPGSNGANTPAAQHQRRSARQEPVPALPDLPVHGREASVSSNSSGYSMDRYSLASSATSPHQPGTNRASPTPLPTLSPSREIHRQLVPIETLNRTRRQWSFESCPGPYPRMGPRSTPLLSHHRCGPVEPPLQGFSQPQRPLPDFASLLPSLTPSNWIGPNAPGRQSAAASPVAASGGRPGVPDNINPRSSPPTRRAPRGHRARRSGKALAKKIRARRNLSREATRILLVWFYEHIAHPYPTEEEKHVLMRQAGLQLSQVSVWSARDIPLAFADRACRSATGSSMPDGGNSPKWTGRPRPRCRCGRLSRFDRHHRTALPRARRQHAKPHGPAVNPDGIHPARLEFFFDWDRFGERNPT